MDVGYFEQNHIRHWVVYIFYFVACVARLELDNSVSVTSAQTWVQVGLLTEGETKYSSLDLKENS